MNYLNLSHSNISKIQIGLIPYGTKIVNLSFNNITTIENIPNTINILYIHRNNINRIIDLPSELKIIYIDNYDKLNIPKHIQNGKVII
jgi:hypothetical protein